MTADLDDLDLDALAGIDDGGNNKPSVWYDPDRFSWVYRASAINACSKQLQLFRSGAEGAPPPPDMLRRFRDGHLHEGPILAEIQKQRPAWKVHPHDPDTGGQVETELWVKEPDREAGVTGIVIVGHIDGLAVNRAMNPDSRICEAKALSDDNYKKFVRGVETGKVWEQYPYYRDSMTVYMASLEVPCFYAVKNKNSGEVFVFDLDEPPGDIDAITSRVRVIDARAARDDIDELCDRRSYPCPMFRFHTDEDELSPDAIMAKALGEDTAPATTADGWSDPERLEQLCMEYDEFRASEKEAGSRKKETGVKIMEEFLLTGDQVQTENFTVKVKQHTYRYIDEGELNAFLEMHGKTVDDFRGERTTEYPDVRRRKKKKGKK